MLTVENLGLFRQGTTSITRPNLCFTANGCKRCIFLFCSPSEGNRDDSTLLVASSFDGNGDAGPFSLSGLFLDCTPAVVVLDALGTLGRLPPDSSILWRFLSLPSSFRFLRESSSVPAANAMRLFEKENKCERKVELVSKWWHDPVVVFHTM